METVTRRGFQISCGAAVAVGCAGRVVSDDLAVQAYFYAASLVVALVAGVLCVFHN